VQKGVEYFPEPPYADVPRGAFHPHGQPIPGKEA
jgi:hypothetical protein